MAHLLFYGRKTTQWYVHIIAGLLAMLFIYSGSSKLFGFTQYALSIKAQVIPAWSIPVMIWLLPVAEILTGGLLLLEISRLSGFIVSSFLLTVFTAYIALIITGTFGRVPCSCGGAIQALSWPEHLFFNIIFLWLALSGIYITIKERRIIGNE